MTAPTSPKPHTPADPNDLRTALTKLADEDGFGATPAQLRALLAAHPAPETGGTRREEGGVIPFAPGEVVLDQETGEIYRPDTRREDVARVAKYQALRDHEPRHMGCACGAKFGDSIDARWHLANQVTAAVLAVLPAPPVVDEAEIAALLWTHRASPTNEIEARLGLKNGCTCGKSGMAVDHQAAAVAARLRGATRG